MEIINTGNKKRKPPVQMVVYGEGGVGKTTFASKAPKPIIADCEGGTKYLGSRGIDVDVVNIDNWQTFVEFGKFVMNESDHETVVIDPIGELMEKLQRHMSDKESTKLTQKDGSPTMAGWGWLKRQLRSALKRLRDSGKNVVVVAHVDEKDDEGRLVKRPMLQTKLSEELVNMVDIVAYMTVVSDPDDPESSKRVLICDPESDRYIAKDRSGQLDRYNRPEWHTDDNEGLLDLVYKGDWENNDEQETTDGVDAVSAESDEEEETLDGVVESLKGGAKAETKSEEVKTKTAETEAQTDEPEGTEIEMMELNGRTEKALKDAGIDTVEKLLTHTEEKLLDINRIAEKSVEEIKGVLHEVGKELPKQSDDKRKNLKDRLNNQNS